MSAPLRVLIVRMGAMGDILHALPAVASMRAGLGEDAVIHWLVEPQWIDLLAVNDAGGLDAVNSAPRGESKPLVDVIVPADVKRWRKNLFSGETAREYLALRRRLSANNYDAAVDFQGAIKSASMAWLSGARFIVGPRTAREALADIFYTVKPEVDSEHVVDQAFDVTEAAVMMFHDDEWQTNEPFMPHPEYLPRDAAAEAWVDQQLTKLGITKDKRFALLTPGAGWPAKQWPAQKFGELAYTLVKEGMPCLINAAPVEAELAEEVVIASQDRARSVVCTLGQLIALTRRASVFVGGDTGPMHLANLLGIPTVALFGPTRPWRNGPYYQPSILLRSPQSEVNLSHSNQRDEGLESITVKEVMEAVKKVMSQAKS